ncbi:MAG: ribonuclease HII [Pseudomonadota bacterium]|nr:ribonuclease HII [Pseudomonadota bacterium]
MKKNSCEKFGFDCGVDEAGRGPLAGPVVAAAVILPEDFNVDPLNDSKKLSPKKRINIFYEITNSAIFGVGFASVDEIDKLNILQATFLAMSRAVCELKVVPRKVLIDGNLIPPKLPYPAEAIVGGDKKFASIAAASIVAKVTRDLYMTKKSKTYPGYGWEKNFGYGVKSHIEALKLLGVTPEHRRSFAPVHNILC